VRLITKEKNMQLEITNGERIMLLVAMKEVIKLVEENPANSPDALNMATKLKAEGLYNKIKEVA
jgi:hypothetical protein